MGLFGLSILGGLSIWFDHLSQFVQLNRLDYLSKLGQIGVNFSVSFQKFGDSMGNFNRSPVIKSQKFTDFSAFKSSLSNVPSLTTDTGQMQPFAVQLQQFKSRTKK